MSFRFPVQKLIEWFDLNQRNLPWRETSDPYRIWVSEIMLQQTRVDTVIPYYHRFLEAFPDLPSLAEADRQTLMRKWEGLGYYSRARNMQDAARTVVESCDGKLPEEYDQLIRLKGIGPYTAAAISSIAWNHPHAVVDGNVIRVLSRYFGLESEMRSQKSRKEIQEIAQELIDHERPGDFNQALMELGATVCKPANPTCGKCPLAGECRAFRLSATDRIPYLPKKKPIPHHTIAVGVVARDEKLLIALRPEEKMLGGLWEFPGGKKRDDENVESAVRRELSEELGVDVEVGERIAKIRHTYSHFKITLHAHLCILTPSAQIPEPRSSQEVRWVTREELEDYPFPKANRELTARLKTIDFS
jgi:A/G-specific adenine glycosylase